MNDRYIGAISFETHGKIKKLVYHESVVALCEEHDVVHVFEVNEDYLIVNHREVRVFTGITIQSKIFDAAIKDDYLYVLSTCGVTKYDLLFEASDVLVQEDP